MFSLNASFGSKITASVSAHVAVNWWMVTAQLAEHVAGGWPPTQGARRFVTSGTFGATANHVHPLREVIDLLARHHNLSCGARQGGQGEVGRASCKLDEMALPSTATELDLVPRAKLSLAAQVRGQVSLQRAAVLPGRLDPAEVDFAAAIEEHDGILHKLDAVQIETLLLEGLEVSHHGAGPLKVLATGLEKLWEDLQKSGSVVEAK